MGSQMADTIAPGAPTAPVLVHPRHGTTAPVVTMSEPVQALVTAVEVMRSQVSSALPGRQALVEAAAVLAALEKLSALSLVRLADVDKRRLYALEGSPTLGSWLSAQQVEADRSRLTLARRLERLPRVAERVGSGALSVGSATRIGEAMERLARSLDRPDGQVDGRDAEQVLRAVLVDGVVALAAQGRGGVSAADPALMALREQLSILVESPHTATRRVEAAFVLLGEVLEPPMLRSALGQLVNAILPVQLEEDAERGTRNRGLTLTRKPDGTGWTVTAGELDLECGELLWTVLHAERAVDPDNVKDTAGWAAARQPSPGQESARRGPVGHAAGTTPDSAPGSVSEEGRWLPAPRSRRQRDHDALKLALRRLLDSGALGLRDKVAPHIAVTVGLDALHDAPGSMPAVAGSGAVLPSSLVRRWLPDSSVTRFVLGLGRQVLEVSHSERTLKAHERRALSLAWGGRCAGAGCDRGPGEKLLPHHVTPWHLSGSTSLADTVPLCEGNHQDLHEGEQILRLKDGRYIGPHGLVAAPHA